MLNKHSMKAGRLLFEVIEALDMAMYPSSYETGLLNKLKRAHNELQRAEGALPFYPEADE